MAQNFLFEFSYLVTDKGKTMKIQGIQSYTTFGYNKKLNELVNKKLEQNSKSEKDRMLLELNKHCMKAEDLMWEAQKNYNIELMNYYGDMLLGIKPFVVEEVDFKYPELNYKSNELLSYKQDLTNHPEKDIQGWISDLTDCIAGYVEENYEDDTPKSDSSEERSISQIEESTSIETGKELLEEFKPNEFSPKGFDSLGGMEKLKEQLTDEIIFPIKNPEEAKLDEIEYGKKYPRGIMFYGPPGCGKTCVVEALSQEANIPLYKLKLSKLGSSYINQTPINLQKAFDYLEEVSKEKGTPVFLLMDEIESITAARRENGNGADLEDTKTVDTLLTLIEEARLKGIIIFAATNKFKMIDDAIKSRLQDKIYIGLPDDKTRESVLKIHLCKRTKGVSLANNKEELQKVVKLTKGFSNRDISILTDKAALIARKDNRREIIASDFVRPVAERQNSKVNERHYMSDDDSRTVIGFNSEDL